MLSDFYAGDESVRRAMKTRSFSRPLLDRVNPALSDVEEAEFVVPAFGAVTAPATTDYSCVDAMRDTGPRAYALTQNFYTLRQIAVSLGCTETNKKLSACKPDLSAWALRFNLAQEGLRGFLKGYSKTNSAGVEVLDTYKVCAVAASFMNTLANYEKQYIALRDAFRTITGELAPDLPDQPDRRDWSTKVVELGKFAVYAALVGVSVYAVGSVGTAYFNQKEKKGR